MINTPKWNLNDFKVSVIERHWGHQGCYENTTHLTGLQWNKNDALEFLPW